MKLAAGEPPARGGYPASVFDSLPRLLERPGPTLKGSITAFYTVLLEGEDESDPLGDEIRSILDGHIYLSRKLAGQGHYPAINVLKSVSRVFGQVTDEKHRDNAARVRKILTTLEDLQVFIAMNARPKLTNWLKQSVNEKMPMSETLKELERIVK